VEHSAHEAETERGNPSSRSDQPNNVMKPFQSFALKTTNLAAKSPDTAQCRGFLILLSCSLREEELLRRASSQ
jgi:hypothetical protein